MPTERRHPGGNLGGSRIDAKTGIISDARHPGICGAITIGWPAFFRPRQRRANGFNTTESRSAVRDSIARLAGGSID
jgi:hypothetical protein